MIQRKTPSSDEDRYGNEKKGTSSVESVCALQQQSRAEPAAGGEFSVTGWLLFLPPGTQVNTGDSVVVGGAVYELTGDPAAVYNPRLREYSHVEATVDRTRGAEDVGS